MCIRDSLDLDHPTASGKELSNPQWTRHVLPHHEDLFPSVLGDHRLASALELTLGTFVVDLHHGGLRLLDVTQDAGRRILLQVKGPRATEADAEYTRPGRHH